MKAPEPAHIMILDDEVEVLENCERMFKLWGHVVHAFQDSEDLVERVERVRPDVVFTDLKMPERDGIAVLEEILKAEPDLPVVIITGFATVESAVEALKKGAFDYITKPFSMDVLKVVTERALEKRRLTRENEAWGISRTFDRRLAKRGPWRIGRVLTRRGRWPQPKSGFVLPAAKSLRTRWRTESNLPPA